MSAVIGTEHNSTCVTSSGRTSHELHEESKLARLSPNSIFLAATPTCIFEFTLVHDESKLARLSPNSIFLALGCVAGLKDFILLTADCRAVSFSYRRADHRRTLPTPRFGTSAVLPSAERGRPLAPQSVSGCMSGTSVTTIVLLA
jgi:hypothetical protein